jgi:dihydroneopterin aldolase
VASLCLAHAGVEQVVVTVEKPGSRRFARSAAIEITRVRS